MIYDMYKVYDKIVFIYFINPEIMILIFRYLINYFQLINHIFISNLKFIF